MREEIKFFIDHFFRTDVRIGIDRYKRQRWVAFLIVMPIILLGLWLMWDDFGYSDAYFEMTEKEQRAYDLKKHFKFAVTFCLMMLLTHGINLPNEIHRANMLNKNWHVRLWILAACFILYIGIGSYFYLHEQPDNLQGTFLILLLSNFVFGGNPYATADEEKLGEKS
ncbi:hypothetical protein [Macrococcoides caseolyticum]|uniref:hypothetical protein n=1 Tax=Macrococcoides caseolyticum TaxID=69966 RepID=UPI001F39E95F|nr:hypothetical protein [Macrococcus caseolyticus]MCE4956276.1 hypothetical protein [Macrococcus caseolyticus]